MNCCRGIQEWGGTIERVLADAASFELASWLHPAEWEQFAQLTAERRKATWLGGRWCVKQLVRRCLQTGDQSDVDTIASLREVAVMSQNGAGQSVRPCVYVRGVAQPWAVTIAHSDRQIYAAMDTRPRASLGIDVVDRMEKCESLATTWFTRSEQQWLASQRDPMAALRIWSAKEAYYKALSPRQPFDPRKIAVEVIDEHNGVANSDRDRRTLPIRWRETDGGLHALASSMNESAVTLGAKR